MNILLASFPAPFEFVFIAMIGLIALGFFVLTIVALIDITTNDFKGNDKIMWVILIVALNPIGLLLYFLVGRKQKLPKNPAPLT